MIEAGGHVIFVDPHGREHNALVTCVHAAHPEVMDEEYAKSIGMKRAMTKEEYFDSISINLIIVCMDDQKTDPYGNQIERHASIVHEKRQQAHGNYWKEA